MPTSSSEDSLSSTNSTSLAPPVSSPRTQISEDERVAISSISQLAGTTSSDNHNSDESARDQQSSSSVLVKSSIAEVEASVPTLDEDGGGILNDQDNHPVLSTGDAAAAMTTILQKPSKKIYRQYVAIPDGPIFATQEEASKAPGKSLINGFRYRYFQVSGANRIRVYQCMSHEECPHLLRLVQASDGSNFYFQECGSHAITAVTKYYGIHYSLLEEIDGRLLAGSTPKKTLTALSRKYRHEPKKLACLPTPQQLQSRKQLLKKKKKKQEKKTPKPLPLSIIQEKKKYRRYTDVLDGPTYTDPKEAEKAPKQRLVNGFSYRHFQTSGGGRNKVYQCVSHENCSHLLRLVHCEGEWYFQEHGDHTTEPTKTYHGIHYSISEEVNAMLLAGTAPSNVLVELTSKYSDNPDMLAVVPTVSQLSSRKQVLFKRSKKEQLT